tara:strand:+ start:903 stop:2216 length:1314 start_codon:yes stop_codon:yes gene_type:complete
MKKKLIFIQLNEINFDLVKRYIESSKKDKFKHLNYIIKFYKNSVTNSEYQYKNLEPWIQWASVHLGKDYNSHKIFRLGDIANHLEQMQIFEKIEAKGFKVGAISPMNTANKLKDPTYFIPDPWTNTKPDSSGFSKRISKMLKQSVNDNSSNKLSINSIITIFEIILRTFDLKKTIFLIKLIFSSINKSWKKSLVLDYLIHMLHLYYLKKKKVNFSSVFLNAGAHIQHHYFYNTKYIENLPANPNWYIDKFNDPIEEMLIIYDRIISDYLNLYKNSTSLLIATGLSQVPNDKIKFYWRLKNHNSFLNKIGIKFSKVWPRMTRDFEITFSTNEEQVNAKKILEKIILKKDNVKIFKEIDERDKSLFVTLTYPNEIKKEDYLIINDNFELNFYKEISFVAIKNGKHDKKGYLFCSPNINFEIPKEPIHVSKIHNIIMNFF